jgi:hypothetical protein
MSTLDICPQLNRLLTTLSGHISINAIAPATLTEIQRILSNVKTSEYPSGYYTGEVDGIPGRQTAIAFARFKEDHWLQYPDILGRSTILALLEVAKGVHPVTEQTQDLNQTPLSSEIIGTRTGASMRLPDNRLVFANELIAPGSYLTWGEFTKNCTRPLEEKYQIANAIAYAKTFAWVRDKWGSPIGMTSGFRPPAINRAVGGVSGSQHPYANAGDVFPITGSIYELLAVIKVSPFTAIGLGMCKGFIHTDIRKGQSNSKIVFSYGC